ncbi:hypothetical protein [Planctopirus hydrillae]|uniref:Uncharacterized protein n=1 Tax=Planctopirus hydrillae TaxID=1841610 RepID=A0A1C3E474_9PLAN|nr:hypothetical protein [Planctopirus hydrillae]ODA28055.1 hypothetical protein A6X21_14435 [Planctopirus hydrillae]
MITREVPLDFSNLAHLDDGKINHLLRHHIQRLAQDCTHRPYDKTSRKVTMDFHIKPVMGADGQLEEVGVEIEVKSKTPVHRSKRYAMRVVQGGLAFNADFPDSVDQAPLPFDQ